MPRAAGPTLPDAADLLLRVIAAVPPATFTGPEDPWLYFYEDFLAVYDPKLRKDTGVYYTLVAVVRAQVRLIDDLLVNRLDRLLGFADSGVVTLDPAASTGWWAMIIRPAPAAGSAGATPKPARMPFCAISSILPSRPHVKNLYNLYVYFWRWPRWKVSDPSREATPHQHRQVLPQPYP